MKRFKLDELDLPEQFQIFLDSILYRDVLVRDGYGAWLMGGACRRVLSGEPYYLEHYDVQTDFDIFFNGAKEYNYVVVLLTSYSDYKVIKENKWFVSLASPDGQIIQLIRKNYQPTARAHANNFDFTVCQVWLEGDELVATDDAVNDIDDRIIRPVRVSNAYTTMRHLMKYGMYGYDISLAMCDAIFAKHAEGLTVEESKTKEFRNGYS